MPINQRNNNRQALVISFSMTLLATTSTAVAAQQQEPPFPVAAMPAQSFLNSRVPFPEVRYRQYRWLSDEERQRVSDAGYTPDEWDQPTSAIVESIPFTNLGILQAKVLDLGLTQEQWDCYINNYSGYSWDQLGSELQIHAVALGWTPGRWEDKSGSKPDIFRNFWDELSDPQKKTAGEFCYFENTWNEENLRFWTTAPPSEHTPSPTLAPTVSPTIMVQQTDPPLDAASSASTTPNLTIFLELLLVVGMGFAFFVV